MAVLKFIASAQGRIFRVVIGLVLIVAAISAGSWVLLVMGIVPLLSGTFDFCLLAPLFGEPSAGKAMRAK